MNYLSSCIIILRLQLTLYVFSPISPLMKNSFLNNSVEVSNKPQIGQLDQFIKDDEKQIVWIQKTRIDSEQWDKKYFQSI